MAPAGETARLTQPLQSAFEERADRVDTERKTSRAILRGRDLNMSQAGSAWFGYLGEDGVIIDENGDQIACDGPGIVLAKVADGEWGAELFSGANDKMNQVHFPDQAAAELFAREWVRSHSMLAP